MRASVLLLPTVLMLLACSKHEDSFTAPPAHSVPTASASASAAPSAAPRVTELASKLHPELLDPSKATAIAPAVYRARIHTSAGDFDIEAHRDWAPLSADRFYNLVKLGFFDNTRFFRVASGFLAQFGISGDPAVNAKWAKASLADEPTKQSNLIYTVSFAHTSIPGSRTTQVFINLGNNLTLDKAQYAPFGKVVAGTAVVDALYAGYGEAAPQGTGPNQFIAAGMGNGYLDKDFPKLETLVHAEIVPTP